MLKGVPKCPTIIMILITVGTKAGRNHELANLVGELTINIVPNAVKNDPKRQKYILTPINSRIHIPIIQNILEHKN